MTPDWGLIFEIAKPTVAAFVGVAVNRVIEKKTKLIAYFTHSAAFNLATADPMTVHTHGIVIKNVGAKPAIDIRVRHHFLPRDYSVFPRVEHNVQQLTGGGAEIVFPRLVQNEQVTISYFYFPPVVYNQIHAGIRHSEGFALEVTALPTQRYPGWLFPVVRILLILGFITAFYLLLKGCILAYSWYLKAQVS